MHLFSQKQRLSYAFHGAESVVGFVLPCATSGISRRKPCAFISAMSDWLASSPSKQTGIAKREPPKRAAWLNLINAWCIRPSLTESNGDTCTCGSVLIPWFAKLFAVHSEVSSLKL